MGGSGFVMERFRRTLHTLLAVAWVLAVPGLAHAQFMSCEMGEPHADAPPEISDFDFLIGNWQIDIVRPGAEGEWGPKVAEAYWEGRYAMGGFAVVDAWYDQVPWKTDATVGRGINTRMYDTQNQVWQMAWQHTALDHVRLLQARRDGDEVEMWQLNPDGSRFEARRTRFHDISENSWVRTDQLTRDGETWGNALRLEATRLGCPLPDGG